MPQALPRHLAIIMDGNGRWARARGLPREEGHRAGAESVSEVVRACRELGIEVLTLYSFSTENWKRPPREVAALMKLLGEYLRSRRQEMLDNGIRLRIVGQLWRLPAWVQKLAIEVCEDTASRPTAMTLNLALSYGGRVELVEAMRSIARDVQAGRLSPEDVDEALISSRLWTAGQPDPDLLIRTSGELRLSNFLLWQVAYTEFYVTPVYWPDFRRPQLMEALEAYSRRERRFGGIGGTS